MKLSCLVVFLVLISPTVLHAQSTPNAEQFFVNSKGVINDQMLVMHLQEQKYPGYAQRVQEVFNRNLSQKPGNNLKSTLHNINVVVHVVHQTPAENIPDSVILSQIEVLNEDFQRLNADTVNLRSIFHPIVGKPNIQFNLAQIIRVPTTSSFSVGLSGLPDNVKQTANGGSDALNTSENLNIWICKLESFLGALFGYAYPPAGLSNWPAGSEAPSSELDGVVLDYRAVGRNNPNAFPNGMGGSFVINGRTATHEVGHYFGMRHIWGDGGGIFGGSSCNEDDGIADTPNQGAQSSNNCDTTLNTCVDPVGDMPDLIENHMDYSDETCKNMWTQMQADFIRNVLENERSGLLSGAQTSNLLNSFNCKVYPNPANEVLHFKLPSTSNNIKVNLIDFQGKIVFSKDFKNKETFELKTDRIQRGLYYILISSEQNTFKEKILLN